MGGCGVRGIFSTCVRRLILSWIPWGRSFPYRPSFFFPNNIAQVDTTAQHLPQGCSQQHLPRCSHCQVLQRKCLKICLQQVSCEKTIWRSSCAIFPYTLRHYLHSHLQYIETLTRQHVHEVHCAPLQGIQATLCYWTRKDGIVAMLSRLRCSEISHTHEHICLFVIQKVTL
jgi:hypothetical protein